MKVNAIICKNCGDLVYSRSRHDFRWCSCKTCAIDGGFDYIRVCGDNTDYDLIEYDLDKKLTKLILFADWARRIDKYGLIKKFKTGKINENKNIIS